MVMIWYGPLLFMPFSVCLQPFLVPCTYAFYDVLSLVFLFLLQVEVPLPTASGTLVEEVIATFSGVSPVMEKEPPSAGVTKEVGQPMQDVQPIPPSIPLAARDPKAS